MAVTATIRLTESDLQIRKRIIKSLKTDLSNLLTKSAQNITIELRKIVKEAIEATKEYDSLNNKRLSWELGLVDGKNRIDGIIKIWTDNINVRIQRPRARGAGIFAGIDIKMIRTDYSDVLASNEAVFTTEKGTDLEWLRWLLTEGSGNIVLGYRVRVAPHRRSRTGQAIMIEDDRRNWRIPPEFSGTPRNNFLTRALNSVKKDMEDAIQKELEKNFK